MDSFFDGIASCMQYNFQVNIARANEPLWRFERVYACVYVYYLDTWEHSIPCVYTIMRWTWLYAHIILLSTIQRKHAREKKHIKFYTLETTRGVNHVNAEMRSETQYTAKTDAWAYSRLLFELTAVAAGSIGSLSGTCATQTIESASYSILLNLSNSDRMNTQHM